MDPTCSSAFIHGYERMAAWSDLLDQINVFPVADADTGRNLKISLAPLRQLDAQPKLVPAHLVRMATGNSGNIAAAFFYELLGVERASQLPGAIQRGMRKARQAVTDPQPGTMLTLSDLHQGLVLVAGITGSGAHVAETHHLQNDQSQRPARLAGTI